MELVSFVCDHAIVVVTTRQILDLDFEEIYELRNLTTDEAVELFKSIYSSPISEDNEKILRREIVEKLLNNNPLAIKLIVKGLPASKNLISLKQELEQSIFQKEDIDEIFESKEDYNIERSASLYHSINYSYINLNESEKLAFELLSLFPDGMHMENFKSFCKASKEVNIGDREIKQLDNKSLLENSNGFLKLQSIISRFSDYKFNERSEEKRLEYYKTAFDYNKFFIDLLSNSSSQLRSSVGLKILDLNTNNYLKSLLYLSKIELADKEKIDYISKVSNIFRDTNQPNEFLDYLRRYEFKFDKKENDVLTLLEQHLIYWTRDFQDPLKFIKSNYSFDKLSKLDDSNELDVITYAKVSAIYKAEGHDLEVLKVQMSKFANLYNASDLLFKLGLLEQAALLVPKNYEDKTYFDYEIEFANSQVNVDELTKYIQFLYKKENLEITQMTYLKSKIMTVSNDELKKLVISNPYTRGLIFLMQAKNETDTALKHNLFFKAKENLSHIKYHYVECIIEYLPILRQSGMLKEFSSNLQEGLSISKKFFFRQLYFQLKQIEGKSNNEVFNDSFLPLPVPISEINSFVKDTIEKNKSYFKSHPNRTKRNISALKEDFS